MKYLRGSRDAEGNATIVEVGLDVQMGDAVLDLIESGIDEDAHFWGSAWRDLDDDDLEFFLKMPEAQARMIEYIRLPLIEKLREVLAARRKEGK
jgi:hypothetical protein